MGVDQERPFLVDGEAANLEVAGGHKLVNRLHPRCIRDDLDQFLALCACHIVSDFHVRSSFGFW